MGTDQLGLDMKKYFSIVPRWLPSLILMGIIFGISSRTSQELPDFQQLDVFIKKTAHAVGYGMLALSFSYGFRWETKFHFWAWALAVLYSATDEFHQSFVPGRHPAMTDVLIFDNAGAILALGLHALYSRKQKDPSPK